MKLKLIKRCSCSGCKKSVYAQGLCYKHYMEKLDQQSRSEKREKHSVSLIRFAAIVCVLLFWLALVAAAGLVCIFLYRQLHFEPWLILLIVVAAAAVLYFLLQFVLQLIEESTVACVVLVILFVTGLCAVLVEWQSLVAIINVLL